MDYPLSPLSDSSCSVPPSPLYNTVSFSSASSTEFSYNQQASVSESEYMHARSSSLGDSSCLTDDLSDSSREDRLDCMVADSELAEFLLSADLFDF